MSRFPSVPVLGLVSAFALVLGSAADSPAADVTIEYSHRIVPHGFPPPPDYTEGNILATFTGTEPITPAVPDPELVQLSQVAWQVSFDWNWAVPKSVDFVTASDETVSVVASPVPRWTLDPARHALPVLHVETDSSNLWRPDSGLYVWGEHNNFLQRGGAWERPANLTWYGTDDVLAFSEPIGLRIHGGSSRFFDQKGLRFYFDDYGTQDDFVFDFFGGAPTTFQRLIVRQARRPLFAMNATLAEGIFGELGHLHSRDLFISVYLNGEYWGAYNLRERYDDEFIEITHQLAQGGEYVFVKDGEEEEGDIQEWWDDLEWFGTSTEPESHAWFVDASSRIDLDTYIDWLLINIFCATADNGFDQNVAQLSIQDGPWRIMMWDEDSILYDANLTANHFRFFAAEDQTEYDTYKPVIFPWPWTPEQQRWCTMFNRFLRNPEFRARFFGRAEELLGGVLSEASLHARLDAIAAVQEAEMVGDQEDRWGVGVLTYPQEIARTKTWITGRHVHMGLQIPPFYESFAQPVELSQFSATAAGGGTVDLAWRTEREIDNQGFIVLRGVGSPGSLAPVATWQTEPALVGQGTQPLPTDYAWTDPSPPAGGLVYYALQHVDLADSVTTHPWIETVDYRDWTGLVLNEIGADNAGLVLDGFGDADPWVELVNAGPAPVQLDSLWITDDPAVPMAHQLIGGLSLAPGERMLLWADGETGEGPTHLGFELEPEGGEMSLFLPDATTLLDGVPFDAQLPDRSYARWPDATGGWSYAFEATPDAVNAAPQLPRFAILNEVQTDNVTTILDEQGDADPWVELANPLPVPLPLGGLELTATSGATNGWALPDSVLAAGGYRLLWVDGEPGEGAWHADFALPTPGGFAGIVWPVASALVDSVTAVSPGADWSLARVPDSFGPWTPWAAPTPGAFNPVPAPVLFVNEFLAKNEAGLTDEAGDHEDWVEIYNPNPFAVDLTGMHLTDDLADPTAWEFPAYVIGADRHIIVWCDDEPGEGPLHATFKLGGSGEDIGLFGAAIHGIVAIDGYTFGAQVDDVSEGRETDGGLPWVFFTSPTPGAPNSPTTGLPGTGLLPEGLTLLPAAPNPFRNGTEIRFVAPRSGRLVVDVYDVTGRRVARLVDAVSEAGAGRVTWDGRDAAGRRVSSGVYFVRLDLDGDVRTGRVIGIR